MSSKLTCHDRYRPVQDGTSRYNCTGALCRNPVQTGTHPFRGVPLVPVQRVKNVYLAPQGLTMTFFCYDPQHD